MKQKPSKKKPHGRKQKMTFPPFQHIPQPIKVEKNLRWDKK